MKGNLSKTQNTLTVYKAHIDISIKCKDVLVELTATAEHLSTSSGTIIEPMKSCKDAEMIQAYDALLHGIVPKKHILGKRWQQSSYSWSIHLN